MSQLDLWRSVSQGFPRRPVGRSFGSMGFVRYIDRSAGVTNRILGVKDSEGSF